MTETVICGVDWADESRAAVRVAKWLSERLGARLLLIHVAPAPVVPTVSVVPGGQAELGYSEERDAEQLLGALAASERVGDDVEWRVAFGDPAAQLVSLAAEEHAQLIVVASRGHSALRAALLGSVSRELASSSPCPVVVVPRRAEVVLTERNG